jgi:hypothetical protein
VNDKNKKWYNDNILLDEELIGYYFSPSDVERKINEMQSDIDALHKQLYGEQINE